MRRIALLALLLLTACSSRQEEASYNEETYASSVEQTAEPAGQADAMDSAAPSADAMSSAGDRGDASDAYPASAPTPTGTPVSEAFHPAAAASPRLPKFDLPAPKPSARANLRRSLFGNPQTAGDVDRSLSAALDAAGYQERSYYEVPGGFALITQPERIHDDGESYSGSKRWVFAQHSLISLDQAFRDFPRSFFDALRHADPGRYRVIVFLVTTRSVTTGNAVTTIGQARTWLAEGGDYLPSYISRIRLTPDHNISVLIYEFRRASVSADPKFVDPSALRARDHLVAAHLFE